MKKIFKNLFSVTLCTALLTGTVASTVLAKTSTNDEVTFYIVRHGKTMLNTTDRVQGWSDAVLTPAGEEVVTYAGMGLSDVKFNSAYSSDSGRAIQTANIILSENTVSYPSLKTDSRLREFNFGTYEGEPNETLWHDIALYNGYASLTELMTSGAFSSELFANTTAKLDAARIEEEGVNWPAENYDQITSRLTESLKEISETQSKNGGGNVLLVSHGLSISALLSEICPDAELPQGFTNASVTVVTYKDGKYTAESINDMSYVEEGKLEAATN
ncbi:MAG: histidine phosphatase family protein [Lachnospirales bacterium]